MPHDQHETATGFNVARYFVEHRHISWVLFAGVLAWGVGAYQAMPKRKDPDIPVRQVAVATPWPGQSAERARQRALEIADDADLRIRAPKNFLRQPPDDGRTVQAPHERVAHTPYSGIHASAHLGLRFPGCLRGARLARSRRTSFGMRFPRSAAGPALSPATTRNPHRDLMLAKSPDREPELQAPGGRILPQCRFADPSISTLPRGP